MKKVLSGLLIGLGLCLVTASPARAADPPQFTLVWSEYPSWSALGVASNADVGFVNGKAGKQGEIERKYNIDLVFRLVDYDTCITLYGSNQTDLVCITNMDILKTSLSRASVAILATSKSHGADGLITSKGITTLEQLRGKPIHGLSKSVSEYMFNRNVKLQGGNPDDYTFTNMDPAAAATALQQRQDGIGAIVVWNPYLLQTLNSRKDLHVLCDSTTIPGEIIDIVVMGEDSLNRDGGKRAAAAVAEVFYRMSKRLNDPSTRNDTLVALGEKFANLTVAQMRQVTRQTQFYGTPNEGIELFTGSDLPAVMGKITDFCAETEMLPSGKRPKITYGTERGDLRFDPSFMKAASRSINCAAGCTKACCKYLNN